MIIQDFGLSCVGVKFGLFLYEGQNFGYFCMRGGQNEKENCVLGLDMPFFVYRGLKNAILLYLGFRKCHFCI